MTIRLRALVLSLACFVGDASHWYTSPATGGLVKPPNYTPFVQMPGVWTGMLNHNPTWKRGVVTGCGNNDVVVREDIDGLENGGCIYLPGWAVDIDDDENSDVNNRLRFVIEVQDDFGSFSGIFSQNPCIDIAGPYGTCCPNPCGACGEGNLHARIRPHHFGQVVSTVTLRDEGQCDNKDDLNNVCSPTRCCESHPLEFHVTVIPVNDCPEFRFRGVDIPQDGVATAGSWLDPANGRDPGTGGEIYTWEDLEVCLPMLVQVSYGGWHEGPGEVGTLTVPWHDQVLVWSVANDDTSSFKTQPHVRYVEGEDSALLCFLPAADLTGEVNLTIHLEDTGGQISNTIGGTPVPCTTSGTVGCYLRSPDEPIRLYIKEINDPPTFNPGEPEVVIYEDSGVYSKQWATDMKVGPSDEAANGQVLSHFEVDLLNDNHKALFLTQPKIGLDGVLEFETRRNVHTYGFDVLCEVRLMDYPPPRSGLSPMYSVKPDPIFRIIVVPVNDPPYYEGLDPVGLEYWEDVSGVERQWARPEVLCAGWDDIAQRCIANEGDEWTVGNEVYPGEGQTVSFTTVAQDPSLFKGDVVIDSNGTLRFSGGEDENGLSKITVTATDDGDVSGSNLGPVTTFTIHLRPVNDPPKYDIETLFISVLEDSTPYIDTLYLHQVSPGPYNERGQVINIITTVFNSELFTNPPTLTLSSAQTTATLSFTPSPDAFGNASLIFYLQDDGGTDLNGDSTSPSHELRIEIRPVNDPPTMTLGPHIIVEEDATTGGYSNPTWISSSSTSPGRLEDNVQYMKYEVDCDPVDVFEVLPAISTSGGMTFTARPDAHGSVLCKVVGFDVDKATDEVISSTQADYFQIGLQRVNDKPYFIAGNSVKTTQCDGSMTSPCEVFIEGWARNITGGANEAHQQLHFTVKNQVRDLTYLFTSWPVVDVPGGGLRFTLKPGEFLEPATVLTVVLRDDGGGDDDSYEGTLVLEVAHVDVVVPDNSGIPVRMAVTQQPVVGSDGSVVPASFELIDKDDLSAAATVTWTFSLYEVNPTTNSIALTPSHVEVAVTTSTATATFSDLTQPPPGKYVLTANATVQGVGDILSAVTLPYTIHEDFGVVSIKNQLGVLSETQMKADGGELQLTITNGAGEWVPGVVTATVVRFDSTFLPVDVVVESEKVVKLILKPVSGFSIEKNGTVTVQIPQGAYGQDSPGQIFTVPIYSTPTIGFLTPSTEESLVRAEGVEIRLELSGDTYRENAAEVIWENGLVPVRNGSLAGVYREIVSTYLKNPKVVAVKIGPGPGYDTTIPDGLELNMIGLHSAVVSGGVRGLEVSGNGFITILPSVEPTPSPTNYSDWWDITATVTEVLSWIVTILSSLAMVSSASLPPGVGICYILIAAIPLTPQPGMQVAHQLQTLTKPFRFTSISSNEHLGAVVILYCVFAVAGLVIFGVSRKIPPLKSPSNVKSLALLVSPTLLFNSARVVVYEGRSHGYLEGVVQDEVSIPWRVAVGVIGLFWMAGIIYAVASTVQTPSFTMYKGDHVGKKSSWVDLVTVVGVGLLAAVADPMYGTVNIGRIAVFGCLAVLCVRIAVTSADPIYVDPVLGVLDVISAGFSAAGLLTLLGFSSRFGSQVGDAQTSHWATYLAAIFFICSLLCFVGFLILLIKHSIFKGFLHKEKVDKKTPPAPYTDQEVNPIKSVFEQQSESVSAAPSSVLEVATSAEAGSVV